MELSPRLYHRLIRPKWLTNFYIGSIIKKEFDFKEKNILDFGCGTGANCSLFNPSHYLGTDPDAARIKYAQNSYPDYDFKIMNECHLPVSNHSIDYILIISVLHHISPHQLPGYLQEFRRILKPEGTILVNEPCFLPHASLNNHFMGVLDRGKYIQSPDNYMKAFYDMQYKIYKIKKYQQLLLYNKVFFAAKPI